MNKKEMPQKFPIPSYGVKDFKLSWSNHQTRIKTLKNNNVLYRDIIDFNFMDNLIYEIVTSTQWTFHYSNLNPSRSTVRQLKTFINWKTRESLKKHLEYSDLTKHYDTAFYLLHYNKINKLMSQVTRILLKEYLGG